MSAKFSFNDEIKANGHKARIISIKGNYFDGYIYRVKFLDNGLMPSEMDFTEEILIKQNPPKPGGESVCPVCNNPWKVVKFNMQTWKDCIKCNKTYEQIMQESKPGKKTVLDELENFPNFDGYGEIDWDDDDGFWD